MQNVHDADTEVSHCANGRKCKYSNELVIENNATLLKAAPRDRPAVTAHRIDIEAVGLGERGHRYRVTYEGRTLIDSCRVPGLDGCRALLALGITGPLEMWRPGKA